MSENRDTPTELDPVALYSQMTEGFINGSFMPVYIEPTPFSGERITCAIAIQSEAGNRVINTLANANCKVDGFNELIQISTTVCESLSLHCKSDLPLESWDGIFQGVYAGKPIKGLSPSLDDLAKKALDNFSFIGSSKAEKEPKNFAQYSKASWLEEVKQQVIHNKSDHNVRFNRKFQFAEGAHETTIGYVGNTYAINFAAYHPRSSNASNQLVAVKSSITDIHAYYKYEQRREIPNAPSHMMISMWRPEDSQLNSREKTSLHRYLAELEQLADLCEVRLKPTSNTQEISSLILND